MSNDSDNSLTGKAAIAAGAAIGSAAIAAAVLFAKRRKDKKAQDAQPPKTGTAPHFPSFPGETD